MKPSVFSVANRYRESETRIIRDTNLMVTLCPLCATENAKLILSYEGAHSSGSEGLSIDGRLLVFSCEQGHVFLRISAATDPSHPSPFWEVHISAKEVDQSVATRRWFGTSCAHVQEHADCHLLQFAVALEAMSNSVEHISQVVSRVWERSISGIQAEAIADTQTGGSRVRKAEGNDEGDCKACGSELSERRQHP